MKYNREAKIYAWLVYAAALAISLVLLRKFAVPACQQILIWGVIASLVESLPIERPNTNVTITVGFTVAACTLIVGGPLLMASSFFLAYIFRIQKLEKGYYHLFKVNPYSTAFNISQSILMAGGMGFTYTILGGTVGNLTLLPLFAALLVGIAINKTLMAGLVSLANKHSFFSLLIANSNGIFMMNTVQGLYGGFIAQIYIANPFIALILFLSIFYFFRYLFKQYANSQRYLLDIMKLITKMLEEKDSYTSGHTERVRALSVATAEHLCLKRKQVNLISKSALLHDIGKIGINDAILNKAGKLTEEECEIIKSHPEKGAQIVRIIPFFKECVPPILYHHERHDGTGYPTGLSGAEIPIESQIIAVADAYDAMTSKRTYSPVLSKEAALLELERCKGTQFNPEVANAFIEMIRKSSDC